MSRDQQWPDTDPDDDEQPPDDPTRRLTPTPIGLLVACFLSGLVLGRLLKPAALSVTDSAPLIGWPAVLLLFFATGIVGYLAWMTHVALQRAKGRLEPHQAVNRLVLAKACALVGAFLGGGYLGYAVGWLGVDSALAHQRLWRAVLAGAASLLLAGAALLLERACRVRRDGK